MTQKKGDYEFPAEVPTEPFFEEIQAVFGGQGSGKTTMAKKLVAVNRPPIVVWIDPTLSDPTSLAELQRRILAGERMTLFAATDPEQAIAAILICYRLSTKSRRVYIVCDEASSYLKERRPDLMKVFKMLRHAGLGILLVSQRPMDVHPEYRDGAVKTFWGRFTDHNVLNLIQQKTGKDKAQSRQTAQAGDFIET